MYGWLPDRCRIDAQQLAEQFAEVQRTALRIAGGPTVAGGDVEEAVRTEHHVAAVVVGVRIGDLEQRSGRVGDERAVAGELVLDDDSVFVVVRVVDVRQWIRWMDGETEESLLTTALGQLGDIEGDSRVRPVGGGEADHAIAEHLVQAARGCCRDLEQVGS